MKKNVDIVVIMYFIYLGCHDSKIVSATFLAVRLI